MNLLSMMNAQFEGIYPPAEIADFKVTSNDISRIIEIAQISLPGMLQEIWANGKLYGLKIKGTSIIIQLCYPMDILDMEENYPFFKEDVQAGLIFATDLGEEVYYYGIGRDGLGLYIAGAGDGNFYEEATKFASTFEEFFMDGKGIDVLKEYYK